MPAILPALNTTLAFFTIIFQILVVFLFFFGRTPRMAPILRKYGILAAWLVALGGFATSLWYSNVANFAPCVLCWWQRIFMYPLVFILGAALLWKDKAVAKYGLILAGIGAAIGLYNSYLQYGGSPIIPCGSAASVVNCAQRFVFEFGYITIPLMSFTAFLLIILLLWPSRNND